MRFCFIIPGAFFAASSLAGAGLPPSSGTATSVVRMDARTGRLVRTVVVPAPIEFLNQSSKNKSADPAVRSLVEETAKQHAVDPLLVYSVIEAESNYNPFAVSHKGAEGLMQLIPSTARRFGVGNSFNSRENVSGGVRYLRYLLDLFKDDRLAVAAYNAGEKAVIRYGGVPPYRETQNYVRQVSTKYDSARRAAGRAKPPAPVSGAEVASAGETYAPIEFLVDEQGNWHVRTRVR